MFFARWSTIGTVSPRILKQWHVYRCFGMQKSSATPPQAASQQLDQHYPPLARKLPGRLIDGRGGKAVFGCYYHDCLLPVRLVVTANETTKRV